MRRGWQIVWDLIDCDAVPTEVARLDRADRREWGKVAFTENRARKTLAAAEKHPFYGANVSFAPISQVTLAGERPAA